MKSLIFSRTIVALAVTLMIIFSTNESKAQTCNPECVDWDVVNNLPTACGALVFNYANCPDLDVALISENGIIQPIDGDDLCQSCDNKTECPLSLEYGGMRLPLTDGTWSFPGHAWPCGSSCPGGWEIVVTSLIPGVKGKIEINCL